MIRILLVGYDPDTVDFSDPALPPGKAAPGAAIAFNTRPDDSADAAARWLPGGSGR